MPTSLRPEIVVKEMREGPVILPLPKDDDLEKSIWDADLAIKSAAKGELRADVVRKGSQPLSFIALATLSLVAIALVLTRFETPKPEHAFLPLVSCLLTSLAWFGVTRIRKLTEGAQRDLGHVFYLTLATLLAASRHYGDAAVELLEFSPSSLLVLAYAALVPASPRRAAALAFGGAALDPMVMMLRAGSLTSVPYALGSIACVGGVAFALSRAIHRLHEGIERAQTIGGYRLVSRLGIGGMAEVWRASHRMLQRPAAVKLIRPEVLLRHGEQGAQRLLRIFLKEARATSRLSSPHTIELYDFGVTEEGSFYYVMELLDGVDLKKLVETSGPISEERAAHLLVQVTRSLEEAHEANLVHRDLKPANVFTCRMGAEYDFAKVLDFGLVLDRHPTAAEIEDESFVGTPTVMAPEMVRFQSRVDARADIYSLGCIAYFLVTGHNVFEAQTRADMLVMHAHQRPIPPSRRLGRTIHEGFENVVMECLEKNPDKRPQSAREVRTRLSALSFDPPWTEERAYRAFSPNDST